MTHNSVQQLYQGTAIQNKAHEYTDLQSSETCLDRKGIMYCQYQLVGYDFSGIASTKPMNDGSCCIPALSLIT